MPAVVETGNERFPGPEGYPPGNGQMCCDHFDVLADAADTPAIDRRTDVVAFGRARSMTAIGADARRPECRTCGSLTSGTSSELSLSRAAPMPRPSAI
jgi:hypothetical protein